MQKCSGIVQRINFKTIILLSVLFISINTYGQNGQTFTNNNSTIVEFRIENDFVFQTDYYFTHGMFLQVFSPFANKNPLNGLLIPSGKNAIVYHGISLVQNLYTPIEKSDRIIVTDRPFAAYLLLQSTRIALYQKERQKISSTFKIGAIGPPALGEEMQNGIHSLLPTSDKIFGWQNQIKTDLMLNYFAQYEKGILRNSFFDTDFFVLANLGAPYTNIGGGLNVRIGKFNDYFANLEFSKSNKWQYYFSFNSNLKFVVYDATLQGGLFNRTSVHTIASADISRFVARASIFGNLNFNNFKMKFGVVFLTREFETGLGHKWSVFSIIFGL